MKLKSHFSDRLIASLACSSPGSAHAYPLSLEQSRLGMVRRTKTSGALVEAREAARYRALCAPSNRSMVRTGRGGSREG